MIFLAISFWGDANDLQHCVVYFLRSNDTETTFNFLIELPRNTLQLQVNWNSFDKLA